MTAPKTEIEVQLSGEDGNVFAIIGRVYRALKRGGERELADEFRERATASTSYEGVLSLAEEYVETA